MAIHLATAISADGVVLAYGQSTAEQAGSSASTALERCESTSSKSTVIPFVDMTAEGTLSATLSLRVPNATEPSAPRSVSVESPRWWKNMRRLETLEVTRDKDDILTSYTRWFVRGIEALGKEIVDVGSIILSTKDMSGLVKETYARVSMRDPEALAEYMRVSGVASTWLGLALPSRAVHEGFILFYKREP